ncbi:hypothetical protein [Xanthomonas sp. NCPPB 2632]|uniref:hypothetical protein n=1 Tax=Xanthomonas sp. NCPPB 2632 TaxID=3240912 RepID=UPI0035120588
MSAISGSTTQSETEEAERLADEAEQAENARYSAEAAQARTNSVAPGPEDEKLNDDERKRFDWISRYPEKARKKIRHEAYYVLGMLVLSFACLLETWRGDVFWLLSYGCNECHSAIFNRYAYVFFAGMMGGTLFGLKYLYKVVARGWWNSDRGLWRYSSPWLAAGLAFATGALAHAGLFGFDVNHSRGGASFVSLGFIAGYFADSASRKMQEIADILFGRPQVPKADDTKGDKYKGEQKGQAAASPPAPATDHGH